MSESLGAAPAAGLSPEVGSKVESMPSQDESRESSRVRSSLERFTGRLRAFDPKCTVGAREVEEAEKSRRTRREREKSLSCAAPLIGYVAHASS